MSSILSPAPRDGVHITYKINDDFQELFEFSPAPFIQCDRSIDFSGKEQIGQTITINVSGTLVAPKHLENDGIRDTNDRKDIDYVLGEQGLSPLERQRRVMEQILSVPGGEFRIYCICAGPEGGCKDITYFRCFPEIIGNLSFQNSPDNWTQTIPYTFQMVFHRTDLFARDAEGNPTRPIYLESIEENWSMELVDEKRYPSIDDVDFDYHGSSSVVMKVAHTLSATGKKDTGNRFSLIIFAIAKEIVKGEKKMKPPMIGVIEMRQITYSDCNTPVTEAMNCTTKILTFLICMQGIGF